MRIADSMIKDIQRIALEKNREALERHQRAAATGIKVEKPSDDPVAASLARTAKARKARAEQVKNVADKSWDELAAADSALGQVSDIMLRIRDIAIHGATDTASEDDRRALAREVDSLRATVISLGNTKYEGQYIFGGLQNDTAPFDLSTGAFTGDTSLREVEVGPGLKLSTQVSGSDAFGATAGSVGVFTTLDSLTTSLNADDPDAVRLLLDDIDEVLRQANASRTIAGTTQEGFYQAGVASQRSQEEAEMELGNLIEANPFEVLSDLVKAENALQQAVAISSRMKQPTLLDGGM